MELVRLLCEKLLLAGCALGGLTRASIQYLAIAIARSGRLLLPLAPLSGGLCLGVTEPPIVPSERVCAGMLQKTQATFAHLTTGTINYEA